jgi:hypothetical protein
LALSQSPCAAELDLPSRVARCDAALRRVEGSPLLRGSPVIRDPA